MFMSLSGRVKVTILSDDGREIILAMLSDQELDAVPTVTSGNESNDMTAFPGSSRDSGDPRQRRR